MRRRMQNVEGVSKDGLATKFGTVWEVGGSGEAHVSSIGDVDGYNHIVQYVYHCTLLQLLVNLLPRFLRNFNPSDIEITWFRKWNS